MDRALAGYEEAAAWDRLRKALHNRAALLLALGRHRESVVVQRGLLAVATEENDLHTAARVLVGLSLEADEWTEALSRSLEAAALARRGGCGGPEMTALANAAEFAVETGTWSTADELLADLQSRPELPEALANAVSLDIALMAAYRGDQPGAWSALHRVSEASRTSANATFVAWYRRVRSVLMLTAGDLTGAYEEAIAAIDAEAVFGPNSTVAAAFAGHAALWLRDVGRAREALDRTPVEDKSWHVAVRRALEAGVDALEGRSRTPPPPSTPSWPRGSPQSTRSPMP